MRFSLSMLATLSLLTACGAPPPTPETIEDSLDRLGVDTTESSRVDANGDVLPEDYAPLGSSPRLNITHEWMVSGTTLTNHGGPVSLLETEAGGEVLLHGTTTPWADSGRVRAVIAGDVDGDGLEESIAVYRDAADITWVQVMEDEEEGFVLGEPLELSRADVRDVAAVSGDFDGDSVAEVAIALTTTEGSVLLRVHQTDSGLAVDADPLMDQPIVKDDVGHWIELASGNLDQDRGEEIVVVVNQGTTGERPSRVTVLDDADRQFAVLYREPVAVTTSEMTASAQITGVAVGDVDDDGIDEIVLGGLENAGNGCRTYDHLLYVLDDVTADFAVKDATRRSKNFRECESFAPIRYEVAHVNVLELDGDRGVEIAFNQFIYDDLTQQPTLTPLFELPDDALVIRQNYSSRFDRGTSDVAVGDVTGDGLDDLVVQSQSAQRNIVVWGIHPLDGWSEQLSVPYAWSNATNPQWIDVNTVDVDVDGVALSYDEGEYKLVFSEPVILAALAAAPCNESIEQNLDACRTAWGTSTSETSGIDGAVTISAGITAGFGAESFGFGGELTETLEVSASFSAAKAYETTKSISYTTGPIEDSVVFTSIPYDQWTYTVASHPDPDLVGQQVVLSVPREPVTLMVERSFYNDSVVDGSTLVIDNVFSHVAGDPSTYRSASARDALLGGQGLVSDPITVGQGGGEVSVSIDVSESTTYRAGEEISYSRDVKTTSAGVIFGMTVGGSVEAGISWGSGEATHYEGRVGQIGGGDFADNYYTYGLFTYVADAGSQQFEVIDYWVE